MKTLEIYLCDKCEKGIFPVDHPNTPNGFIVEGNIYVADQNEGGLVGNNFPQGAEEIRRSEIKKTCLCKDCFFEVLHLNFPKNQVDPWKPCPPGVLYRNSQMNDEDAKSDTYQ
jgi:hypothetical protein